MFTTIMGIPAHPLLIHAAVVFIPLLIVAAIVYAALPQLRKRIDWATLALAIIAPLAALFAKISGQNLKSELIAKKLASPQLLAQIAVHNSYGNHTFWWTLALGVATLILFGYYVMRGRQSAAGSPVSSVSAGGSAATAQSDLVLRVVSTVVLLVLGAFVGYYIYRTGDTGAHMVWQGI